jgi:hypothetical protein
VKPESISVSAGGVASREKINPKRKGDSSSR